MTNNIAIHYTKNFSLSHLSRFIPTLALAISVSSVLGLSGCDNSASTTNSSATQPNSSSASPASSAQKTSTDTSTESSTDSIDNNLPKYVMAVEAYYPPYSFKDEMGHLIGYDIDLIKEVAAHANFNVSVMEIPWEGAFEKLKQGSFQILGSGVGITPERQEIADFSTPYMEGYIAFAYTSPDINSTTDIENKTIGMQPETFYVKELQSKYADHNTLEEYKTNFLACKNMLNAKIDLCINDINILHYMFKQLPDTTKVSDVKYLNAFGDEKKQVAFAVQKGDIEMKKVIDEGLAKVIADGTYDKLHDKWFSGEKIEINHDDHSH